MHILVTGGAGFIGSNFIQYLLTNTNYEITNIDCLTYAGKINNIEEFKQYSNYRFIECDITEQDQLSLVFDRKYDGVVHFAAETHVDRSIQNPAIFLQTNVLGTFNLLNKVKENSIKRFLLISTDEVYGSLLDGELPCTEKAPLAPNNPYSASKASAELVARSYYQTYQTPVIVTRCSNNYGPRQDQEKFIPKVIFHALKDIAIPIYGDGLQVRDWLYVKDHCIALLTILQSGEVGQVYNIGGGNELRNLEVVQRILSLLGKNYNLIEFVEDRKGHDRRYSIDSRKIQNKFGWCSLTSFETGLSETIKWYVQQLRSDQA